MKKDVFEPNIVSIGGGTGLSTMLRGLKKYTHNITAVVTVADDGGGSGVLRTDLNMPPPGDIRNCILALSETEPVMNSLLRYRFSDGMLAGQSFGNLFLAAMTGINDGDFVSAVKQVSDVLKVTGTVFPVTDTDVELVAELESGQLILGESNIGKAVSEYGSRIKYVYLRTKRGKVARLLPDIKEKIRTADIITLGPGSLYTSILSALGVCELVDEIRRSDAPVVYINNVMTQPGETDGYTAYDHVRAILENTCEDFIDYCIVNDKMIDTPLRKRYAEKESEEVILDEKCFEDSCIKLVKRNLVGLIDNKYIRHNPVALADTIMDIACRERFGSDKVSGEGVRIYKPKRHNI